MRPNLPKWPTKLIANWCAADYREEILGDLEEEFYKEVALNGLSKARIKYWWTAIKSLRPYLRKPPQQINYYGNPNPVDMIKNYIKIAIRSISKQKIYASINIFGLSVGLACCMLISLFITHELSYDKFHKDVDDIYRVNVTYNWGGQQGTMVMTPTALLPTLQRNFPEVDAGVRVFRIGTFSPLVIQREELKFEEPGFLFVDSAFFDVFSFNLLKGDAKKALVNPNSLILTESMAKKYFGDSDPMGQIVQISGNTDYQITGIVEDLPDNSHITFDMLGSFSSTSASKREIWGSANYSTYIKLNTDDASDVSDRFTSLVVEQLNGIGWLDKEDQISYRFEPIKDIHLRSELNRELEAQGDITTIYIIGAIGILILIIACVNYMNLATARSIDRAREVGMRKVMGAVRPQLFYQFMGESILITFLALIGAMIWVNFTLPQLNSLTNKSFLYTDLINPTFLLSTILIVILVALISGAYPALALSRFNPADVLKGGNKKTGGGNLRKALVVFQFAVSILLILATIVVYDQLQYMTNKKLGYDKENVLVVPIDYKMRKDHEKIKGELLRQKEVVNISFGSDSPAEIVGGYGFNVPELGEDSNIGIRAVTVDPDFVKTLGMELIAGSDFTTTDFIQVTEAPDSLRNYAFIVNEALLEQLYLTPESAIGMIASSGNRKGEIRGVVKNFHFASLHDKIEPMAMFIEPWQFNHMLIRIMPKNVSNTLSVLEDKWNSVVPHRPFLYQFLDQEYNAMYKSEQRTGELFTIFSTLAILIACLGLFGLVSFTALQRSKEIGVRKVLGATVSGLVILISQDYAKLILIAFLIAAPIGYWAVNNWLTIFEYRIALSWSPFVIAMLTSILVAFITISYQAIKSALLNPADVLKNRD